MLMSDGGTQRHKFRTQNPGKMSSIIDILGSAKTVTRLNS